MKDQPKRVLAIIQARMGSTRLPGKILEDLAGRSMLARVVNRTRRAEGLADVVIATTLNPHDDVVEQYCAAEGWHSYRGSEDDVLDRYYQAALAFGADVIVRITCDCPLIEPEIIGRATRELISSYPEADYVSNTLTRTFPRGLDVEVMTLDALERAWREDDDPAWREHVTPYIYRHPERFKIRNILSEEDFSAMRWTVDTAEDLDFVREIYRRFKDDTFNWKQVLQLLEANPELAEINREVTQKEPPGAVAD